MAVIEVTPQTNISALIASGDVNEGDVLLLEEGIYFQTVTIRKNNIRLVAKGSEVIFDGKATLFTAFSLLNVVGVVIEGIHIRHYRDDGIFIQAGSANRILNNRINNMVDFAIDIIGSTANLIWKNHIQDCRSGIRLGSGSISNWIIDNTVRECFSIAFSIFQATAVNNAFISNKAIGSRGNGFTMIGSNNLLMDNLSIDNDQGVSVFDGSHSLAIRNRIQATRLNAFTVFNEYQNYFAGENQLECNGRIGINIIGEFGIFLNNESSYNADTGITLATASRANLVKGSKLVCNIPQNMVDSGSDNNLIDNTDRPCEPCQSPEDICGHCQDKERKCGRGSN